MVILPSLRSTLGIIILRRIGVDYAAIDSITFQKFPTFPFASGTNVCYTYRVYISQS